MRLVPDVDGKIVDGIARGKAAGCKSHQHEDKERSNKSGEMSP